MTLMRGCSGLIKPPLWGVPNDVIRLSEVVFERTETAVAEARVR